MTRINMSLQRKYDNRNNKWNGLTLSAFRRDEESIRIVDSDRSRRITDFFHYSTTASSIIGYGGMSVSMRLATRISDGQKVAIKTISKHDLLHRSQLQRFEINHSTSQQNTRRSRKRERVSSNGNTERSTILREWEALRMFRDNENVVDLIDVFESNDEIHLVMEYCNGGEIYHLIQNKLLSLSNDEIYTQNEIEAAEMMRQILKGLKSLHDRGIAHCDIKPENILLKTKAMTNQGSSSSNQNIIKLCDFGSAQYVDIDYEEDEEENEQGYESDNSSNMSTAGFDGESSAKINRSSNIYEAPELSSGHGRKNYGISAAVDMYSLGVTLYVLLYGHPPVFDVDNAVTFSSPVHTAKRYVSEDAKNLIREMLHLNPRERISAKEALNSPWLQRKGRTTASPFKLGRPRSLSLASVFHVKRQQQRKLSLSLNNKMSSSQYSSPNKAKRRRLLPNQHHSGKVSPALFVNICRTLAADHVSMITTTNSTTWSN